MNVRLTGTGDESMVIGYIGLGLIGGSIAKTMRRVHPEYTQIAYNRTNAVVGEAIRDGVIDEGCFDISAAFSKCDYIFLCVPVMTMREYLKELAPIIKEGAIITDVGSTKGDIHEMVHELGLDAHFIGGHPMAGSEKTGYANATDRMIENAWYILTPGDDVEIHKVSEFSGLIGELGAMPLVISADENDYVTAAISHVPHVISASLVNMVHDIDSDAHYMHSIAAGGFKDITRISSSSPQMWQEICLANSENICAVLGSYIRKLTDFRFAIRNGDEKKLLEYFTACKDYRDSFSDRSVGPIRKQYRIYMDLADEAGAIAEIAVILGNAGISISNIGIVHNREFEQGVLRIEFYDEAAMKRASEVLKGKNYKLYEA